VRPREAPRWKEGRPVPPREQTMPDRRGAGRGRTFGLVSGPGVFGSRRQVEMLHRGNKRMLCRRRCSGAAYCSPTGGRASLRRSPCGGPHQPGSSHGPVSRPWKMGRGLGWLAAQSRGSASLRAARSAQVPQIPVGPWDSPRGSFVPCLLTPGADRDHSPTPQRRADASTTRCNLSTIVRASGRRRSGPAGSEVESWAGSRRSHPRGQAGRRRHHRNAGAARQGVTPPAPPPARPRAGRPRRAGEEAAQAGQASGHHDRGRVSALLRHPRAPNRKRGGGRSPGRTGART